jgi:hypothetical protein
MRYCDTRAFAMESIAFRQMNEYRNIEEKRERKEGNDIEVIKYLKHCGTCPFHVQLIFHLRFINTFTRTFIDKTIVNDN